MQIDHVIDVKDAVEYLQQFAWVKDFDQVIQQILQPKESNDEN
jgi:hypothetical protein